MVGNIKLFDQMFDFVKEHKTPVTIVSTGVLIAGLILSGANSKPKEVFPYMPAPTKIEDVEPTPVKVVSRDYKTSFIEVGLNQIMRLEPRSDGKYVGRIEEVKDAELLYIDGDHALISYTDKKGMTRLGYVETSGIAHLDEVGTIYQASKTNMYGEITTNNCRIQNDTYDDADNNILTRGKKGEYVKIIGEYREGNNLWYIVIYRDYIGYMKPDNLNIVSEDIVLSMSNNSYVKIVGSKVRFRRSPKLDKNNIILEIDRGTKLPVVSKEKDWYYVYYNGEYGYVSTRSDCTREIYESYTPPGLSNVHLERESSKSI